MKITVTKDKFTVETKTKARSYVGIEVGEESESLKMLMESEFAKDSDFEPDEVWAHETCGRGTTRDGEPVGCSLPTLECPFGFPKFMPDMEDYGEPFVSDLNAHLEKKRQLAEIEKQIQELDAKWTALVELIAVTANETESSW
jgi:hypothetical protein